MPPEASILIVLPRNMNFSEEAATSIDLCAYDFVLNSVHRSKTLVCGAVKGRPLPGVSFEEIPGDLGRRDRRSHICSVARRHGSRVIVVHQHLPTALYLKRQFPERVVVMHRHNYTRRYADTARWRRIFKPLKACRMASIDQYVVVSESVRDAFIEDWPALEAKCLRIHNFVNFDEWAPSVLRTSEIVFAGRCVPEKGVLEAARAITVALSSNPGWKATFILSRLDEKPAYADAVLDLLKGSPVEILIDQPFAVVKARMEEAAVALVPSLWKEPFGRTALEAHAGGAAVISSGRGGLTEVSGDAALYVDPENLSALVSAIDRLMNDNVLRQRLQSQGRDHVRRTFSLEETVVLYDRMIGEALARTPTAGFRS